MPYRFYENPNYRPREATSDDSWDSDEEEKRHQSCCNVYRPIADDERTTYDVLHRFTLVGGTINADTGAVVTRPRYVRRDRVTPDYFELPPAKRTKLTGRYEYVPREEEIEPAAQVLSAFENLNSSSLPPPLVARRVQGAADFTQSYPDETPRNVTVETNTTAETQDDESSRPHSSDPIGFVETIENNYHETSEPQAEQVFAAARRPRPVMPRYIPWNAIRRNTNADRRAPLRDGGFVASEVGRIECERNPTATAVRVVGECARRPRPVMPWYIERFLNAIRRNTNADRCTPLRGSGFVASEVRRLEDYGIRRVSGERALGPGSANPSCFPSTAADQTTVSERAPKITNGFVASEVRRIENERNPNAVQVSGECVRRPRPAMARYAVTRRTAANVVVPPGVDGFVASRVRRIETGQDPPAVVVEPPAGNVKNLIRVFEVLNR